MGKQDHLNRVAEARARLAAAQTPENLHALATALRSLGVFFADTEQSFADAIGPYEEAIAIFGTLEDDRNAANAYFNLGVAYEIGLQEYDLASRYIKKALELTQDPGLRAHYERELDCIAVSRLKKGRD